MVYKWKFPGLIPVDAQVAGEELSRIYEKHGKLEPSDIVAENKSENAPLHNCFEWDNEVAANKYREGQAQFIIQSIVTVCEGENKPQEVRAFVSIKREYLPIDVVVNSQDLYDEMLNTAKAELHTFRRKYESLKELSPVIKAIDDLNSKMDKPDKSGEK